MKNQNKTNQNKKLKLERQTIREIKPSDLEQNVVGGAENNEHENDRTEPC